MSANAGEDDQGSSTTAVKFQVSGTKRGSRWDDGVHSDVKRLMISHDEESIGYVCFEYVTKNRKSTRCFHHGSTTGITNINIHQLHLDYPDEYLTSLHGYFDEYRLKSLTFESNTKTWGPYGEEKGTKFSFPIIGAKIVGFHGWSDSSSLNAIGVYVQPITNSMPQLQLEQFSLGQYGSEDGESWVESFRAIKRLVICSNDEWIISIQLEYVDDNGDLVLSKKHGGDGGTPKEFVLEYPDERLVTICGYYDNSLDSKSSTNMIRSLTVKTNKKTSEPFGVEKGTNFVFPINARLKVVGIHGKSGLYLNAIGLHVTNAF